jgi:hypothetical protein
MTCAAPLSSPRANGSATISVEACPREIRAFASSEYYVAMQRTQIRLNQTRAEKISSQFDFGCFS